MMEVVVDGQSSSQIVNTNKPTPGFNCKIKSKLDDCHSGQYYAPAQEALSDDAV